MLRYGAWLAIVLLSVYLVLVGGTYLGIETLQVRVASIVLCAIGLAAWLIVAWRRPAWRPASRIWPAPVAVLAAFGLSTFFSWSVRISAEMSAYAVLAAALYLLLVRLLSDPFFRARFGAVAVGLCAVVSVAYMARVLLLWVDWWSLVGRVALPPLRPLYEGLTFQTPNPVATLALVLLAFSVAHVGLDSRGRRASVVVLAALAFMAAVLTASRGAWLGLGAAVVASAATWLLLPGHRAELVRRIASGRRSLALAGLALAVLVLALGPSLAERFGAGGGDLRISLVGVSLRLFETAPLSGSGPGTWVVRRAAFTPAGEPDVYIPHAHNIYAQTLAEFGLAGLLAGIVLVGCLTWLVASALRDEDRVRRRFGLAAVFTLTLLGAQQLVDSFANLPAILFAGALVVARLDATSTSSIASGRLREVPAWNVLRRFAPGALALAVALALGGLAWIEWQALAADRGVQAANAGDWSEALADARQAAGAEPSLPVYQFEVGLAASHVGNLGLAAEALAHSAARDDFTVAWLDLAAVQAARGDPDAARSALDRAVRLGSQQAAVALAAGALWSRLDDAAARGAYVQALLDAPSLAGDPYWSSTPDLRAASPAMLEAALARADPRAGFELALLGGRTALAEQLAARLDAPTAGTARLVIAALGGDSAAAEALRAQALASPDDSFTVGWCARLAARAGDAAGAARYRRWLAIVDPLAAIANGFDLRVIPGEASGSVLGPGLDAYGPATYRRSVPRDRLVPGLPRLELR